MRSDGTDYGLVAELAQRIQNIGWHIYISENNSIVVENKEGLVHEFAGDPPFVAWIILEAQKRGLISLFTEQGEK